MTMTFFLRDLLQPNHSSILARAGSNIPMKLSSNKNIFSMTNPSGVVERRKNRGRPTEDEDRRLATGSSHHHDDDDDGGDGRKSKGSSKRSSSSSFSKSLMICFAGTLVGYVILPIILLELNMDDKLMQRLSDIPPENKNLRALGDRTMDIQARIVEDQLLMSSQSMPTPTSPNIMKTKVLPDHKRNKILVTGGAGFVGSHLVDKLMMEGHEVIVVDNFFTGQKKNIAHWLHHPHFR
jgi:hypothetical protein